MPHIHPKLNGTERAGPGLGDPLASVLRDRVMPGMGQNQSRFHCDALGPGTSHLHKHQHTINPALPFILTQAQRKKNLACGYSPTSLKYLYYKASVTKQNGVKPDQRGGEKLNDEGKKRDVVQPVRRGNGMPALGFLHSPPSSEMGLEVHKEKANTFGCCQKNKPLDGALF